MWKLLFDYVSLQTIRTVRPLPLCVVINHKLFSVDYINVIKNLKNIECSYDVSLSLHQKSLKSLMKRKRNVI